MSGPTRSASSRARAVLGVAALLTACAVALGSGVAVGRARAAEEDRPARIARQYVDAIAAGDAVAANRLARIPAARAALLTDEVMRSAERIRVRDVRPETGPRPASDDRAASFSVAYMLAGARHRGSVTVARDDRGWYVRRGLAVAAPGLPRKGTGVRIAGSAIPLAPGDLAYPGRYALTGSKRLFALSGEAALTVADGHAAFGAGFAIRPSSAFAAEVQHAVEARLGQCMALTAFEAVVACGIALDEPLRVDPARAEVAVTEREPARVEVAGDGGASDFILTGGRYSARVRGSGSAGRVIETVAGSIGDLRPRIALDGDRVRVDFDGPLAGGKDTR